MKWAFLPKEERRSSLRICRICGGLYGDRDGRQRSKTCGSTPCLRAARAAGGRLRAAQPDAQASLRKARLRAAESNSKRIYPRGYRLNRHYSREFRKRASEIAKTSKAAEILSGRFRPILPPPPKRLPLFLVARGLRSRGEARFLKFFPVPYRPLPPKERAKLEVIEKWEDPFEASFAFPSGRGCGFGLTIPDFRVVLPTGELIDLEHKHRRTLLRLKPDRNRRSLLAFLVRNRLGDEATTPHYLFCSGWRTKVRKRGAEALFEESEGIRRVMMKTLSKRDRRRLRLFEKRLRAERADYRYLPWELKVIKAKALYDEVYLRCSR